MTASPEFPPPDRHRCPSRTRAAIVTALAALGTVVGTLGSWSVRLGWVSLFWPGQTVQAIGSIWYGGWGILAGCLFPFLSNWLSQQTSLWQALLLLPANCLQAALPGWAFRYYRFDPSLRSPRAVALWLTWGILLPNVAGATWGTASLHWSGELAASMVWPTLLGWLAGNGLPTLIAGSAVLTLFSRSVTRTRGFCSGYWA